MTDLPWSLLKLRAIDAYEDRERQLAEQKEKERAERAERRKQTEESIMRAVQNFFDPTHHGYAHIVNIDTIILGEAIVTIDGVRFRLHQKSMSEGWIFYLLPANENAPGQVRVNNLADLGSELLNRGWYPEDGRA